MGNSSSNLTEYEYEDKYEEDEDEDEVEVEDDEDEDEDEYKALAKVRAKAIAKAKAKAKAEAEVEDEDKAKAKAEAEVEVKTRPFPCRVIDTNSLEFTEIPDGYGWKGRYATLSHTWIYEEEGGVFYPVEIIYEEAKILFKEQKKEMQKLVKKLEMRKKLPRSIDPSTSKLLNAIHAAKKMNHGFLWIDTCCINKEEGSDETGVSLPSMGDWYMKADTCLVFLDDLPLSKQDVSKLHLPTENWREPMQPPKWATRCWTLQEIILSQRAVFFNKDWKKVFDFDRKKPPSLQQSPSRRLKTARILYKLCWVPELLICNGARPDVPPSMILNLAYIREATKPEDRAYSLMGFFGVKLPLNYGEGFHTALGNLREEIHRKTQDLEVFNNNTERLKRSSDHTISRICDVYPIDCLEFLQQAWDEYAKIKQSPSVGGKRKLNSFMEVKCQLVWNHGIKKDLVIDCRMESLLFVLGGKTEWVFLRVTNLGGFKEWHLAEIAQEKNSNFEDGGTLEIFARKIKFSPSSTKFLDDSEFRGAGGNLDLKFDYDRYKFVRQILDQGRGDDNFLNVSQKIRYFLNTGKII